MRRTAALPSLVSSAFAACAFLALPACGLLLDTSPPDPRPEAPDGATPDADVTTDAGFDAGPIDAGPLDAGFDGGPIDAGPIDAGPIDAGPLDAGFDAGPIDAGFDAGPIDAGFDAGPIDAGFDAGPCVDRDSDGDGFSVCDGDCDDTNALVYPGFVELCNDGLDNDCDPGSDDFCSGGLGTYVSALIGNDANPGTRDRPVATIRQGIANALALGAPQTLIVGGGLYIENIDLEARVSLRGGFRCASDALCDWAFDPIAAESTIQNEDSDGVVADDTIREDTVVEDFHILGSASSAADLEEIAGVTLRGGAPTLRDNRIEVRVAPSGLAALRPRLVGVSLQFTTGGHSAQILSNLIATGPAMSLSAPIRFNGAAGERTRARVEGNVLQPGEAQRSVGVVAFNSDDGTEVVDNDFLTGTSRLGAVHGIEVASTMRIAGNRIHVPGAVSAPGAGCMSASAWCAGVMSASATLVLENNVIYGPPGPRSAAVVLSEVERAAGRVSVANNLLDGGGGALAGAITVRDKSAALVYLSGPCAGCTAGASVFGELRNNILLGGRALDRYGIYEDPFATTGVSRDALPQILDSNDFFFATIPMASVGVLYRRSRGGTVTNILDLATVNALSLPAAMRNLLVDPRVDTTHHLLAGSLCIDTGTDRGAPVVDFEGDPRPRGAAFDIGPDEY
jgi:hypothetical protein